MAKSTFLRHQITNRRFFVTEAVESYNAKRELNTASLYKIAKI